MTVKPFARGLVAGGLAALVLGGTASAGPDPYIGQVIAVGENFCPRGYMTAAGQLLPISTYTALFSLVGCDYGGDCRTTFRLPDLRGRAMINEGRGPGLPYYDRGQSGGSPSRTLTIIDLPNHNHAMRASLDPPTLNSPAGNGMPTYQSATREAYSSDQPGSAQLNGQVVSVTGGSQSFDLYQPTLAVNMCVAVEGIYPPRD